MKIYVFIVAKFLHGIGFFVQLSPSVAGLRAIVNIETDIVKDKQQ